MGFQTRPAAPPARPALTFQDTPSSPLPPSALEVVDFNELLGVFQGQGGSSSGQRSPPVQVEASRLKRLCPSETPRDLPSFSLKTSRQGSTSATLSLVDPNTQTRH